ncbi:insulin-like peptide INSL6 [Cricetulus griseus]|uniref:Insulin-like peptide INSL6 n=2 Tax=Cricetulus griseus TaxID=10029 RepID=A0A9J7JGV0_CRIGR|nr:insulin-like peptide INSL6 [Cricetulus griseus]XP_027262568.1 insulin-like peptide INSL6 [Cricetulus griseus]
MKQLCCSCLLWFGLLQAAFSWEEMENRPRKLCGKHLLSQIIKLCGQTDWTQFEIDEQTSLGHIPHQSSHPPKTLKPEQIPSSSAWRKFTHPVPASTSQEKVINTWEGQPVPDYQFENTNVVPENTRKFSSHDANPYPGVVKLQKKSTDKINTHSSLFGRKHPQREQRGFSDKCCLKGCTKEELAVACLPYVDFKTNNKRHW